MTELNNSLETTASQETPLTPLQANSSHSATRRRLMWAGAVLLVLIAAALVAWRYLPPTLHGLPLQSPRVADDFTLPTSTGQPMSLIDFRGKYVVLFFGYTSCPDVCPTTLADIQQMLKKLGAKRASDVQVLMVSVDPERDSAEQLATYLHAFD